MGKNNKTFITIDREIHTPDEDFFHWDEQAKRLALLLALPGRPTPLTLGIQGDWGSGKTSFINLMLHHLGEKQSPVDADDQSLANRMAVYQYAFNESPFTNYAPADIYVVKFDSWVFTQSQWPADYLFPLYVTQVIRDYLVATGNAKEDGAETGLLSHLSRVLPAVGSGLAAAGGAAAGYLVPGAGIPIALLSQVVGDQLADWLIAQEENAQPGRLNAELVSFKPRFQEMINKLLTASPEQQRTLNKPPLKGMETIYNRLIVLVDDLDRVKPVTAVSITEKIKLFMDVPGCIFILASDLKIIRAGLREKLGKEVGEEESKNYLDKIVKIQYQVPHLAKTQVRSIARSYIQFKNAFRKEGQKTQAETLLQVFSTIAANPRNLKRTLNNFTFTLDLKYGPGATADPNVALPLLAVTILQQYDTEIATRFYRWLARKGQDETIDAISASELAQALQPDKTPPQQIQDFAELIAAMGYTAGAWRSAFTLSTLTSVNAP